MLKTAVCWALAGLFVAAGRAHFTNTEGYMGIMPPYLPWHRELVLASGVFEVAGGLGLLFPATRRAAGVGLAALLVAVFPANIHMAVSGAKLGGFPSEPWMAWARLPLQPALIAAVLWGSHNSVNRAAGGDGEGHRISAR